MSIVTDIFNSLLTIVPGELSPDYRKLRRVINVDETDLHDAVNGGWGVKVGSGSNSDGVTKFVTIDQTYSVVLSSNYIDQIDDEAKQAAVSDLFDEMEKILIKIVNTKAGVPSSVLIVTDPSYDEPEYFDASVALTMNFVVKYRKQLI